MPRLTQESFNEWKRHPLTEAFRLFLRDYRTRLADQWVAGNLNPAECPLVQKQAQTLWELETLEWEAVDRFYNGAE